MMTVSQAVAKMAGDCKGNQYDIGHFMKVWGYARIIGNLEGLDPMTQEILEYAAVVHDIACPDLREVHGNAPGHLQEQDGPAMVRSFFQDGELDPAMLERICYLVGHHHTYRDVNGMDHQILLEADFLVNAGESEKYHKQIDKFRKNVFRTESGLALLEQIYGNGEV